MLGKITDDLLADLAPLTFGLPITHVYNPLVYARAAWDTYCKKYGQGRRDVLLWGMNPGPFGMSQCGVPFGELAAVRDWLDIVAPIGKPENEHPKRPIQGFDCPRSEVSGARLWGWAADRFGTPEKFFERFFVANYSPLVFMEASGKNHTPDKLPKEEREALFAACGRALRQTVDYFQPRFVIGVGNFAETRIREALGTGHRLTIGRIPHPSPASPTANRGWSSLVDQALAEMGL